ncbi:TRAP transporter substrate-binding protein [Rubrivivax albus]|uniref:TRAP transporter substrate-binding protein n=1 Tax=Rubrivivax albus TaxID=2499835 RepID=A0A437JUM9_9BURK|nr:TRAP transporter substrate-binding protein [Rubrivivax albus]RVT50944.1 TRAP transporter substrate-binding protein [Rubrivivax albus]
MSVRPFSGLTRLAGLALTLGLLSSVASATELRFSSFEPPVAFLTKNVFPEWGRRVAEATNNEVTVKMFPGGTLGRSPAQQLQLVADGVADVAFIVAGYNPGVFPGVTVGELPYTVTSAKAGSVALWKMYEQGLLDGDFAKYKIIGLFTTSPQGVASKGKIASPADMKGKKFRASSPNLLTAIEKMGAVAVGGITAANLAESVSRGVIDGSFNEWNAIKSFRLMETVDHVLEVPMGTSPLMVVMNKAKYDGLSAAAKAGIDKVSGAAFSAYFGEQFDEQNAAARAEAVKAGKITITTPDAATVEAWRAATRPAIDGWLAADPKRAKLLEAYNAAMK